MKANKINWWGWLLILAVSACFASCSDEDETRPYEGATIPGVKVNGTLYLTKTENNVVYAVLPAGEDLSNVRLQVMVTNGTLTGFENDIRRDCRKPIDLVVNASDGEQLNVKLRVQSPPALANFIIEGMVIDKSSIYWSDKSLIVQVPKNADLKALNVSMILINGTAVDFENGMERDYTEPVKFNIKGVDEETIYPYELIITTEQVGPASVKKMILSNGVETDSVALIADDKSLTLVPYFNSLTNFSNVDVTLETGFGNRIDAAFTGKGLNLLKGDHKVKITGSDGIEKEFTIGVPKLSLTPLFSVNGDASRTIAFSGDKIVGVNMGAATIYDMTGANLGKLSIAGTNINTAADYGVHKLATDDKGVILGVQMGNGFTGTKEVVIYKWNSVTDAAPTKYITFSQSSLGVSFATRTAGLNVSGALDGNATITVALASSTTILEWTVTNGVLNPTPQKKEVTTDGKPSNYYSVEPLADGGYVMAVTTSVTSGVYLLSNTLSVSFGVTGIQTTDVRVTKYNGRVYCALPVFASGKGHYLRLFDITDGQKASFSNPIMDVLYAPGNNGNLTMDADFAVINGKLHIAFLGTNSGIRVYCLEK